MNAKGRQLGRGLEALLGHEEGGSEPGSLEGAALTQLAVDLVDPNPFQPRRHFDPGEIASLADSLRQHGLLQPIIVRPIGGAYQLIAGERRLRASIEAQLHEIPARVLELDDQRVFELAMVENLQREDLNAIDKAIRLPRLPGPLRRDPGRTRRPDRHRPLDGLEPHPTARPPRGDPGRRPFERDQPGPCASPAVAGAVRDAHRGISAGRHRAPLGASDRGPGQHRHPDPEPNPRPQGPRTQPGAPSPPRQRL